MSGVEPGLDLFAVIEQDHFCSRDISDAASSVPSSSTGPEPSSSTIEEVGEWHNVGDDERSPREAQRISGGKICLPGLSSLEVKGYITRDDMKTEYRIACCCDEKKTEVLVFVKVLNQIDHGTLNPDPPSHQVWRRHSDLKILHDRIAESLPVLELPSLHSQGVLTHLGITSNDLQHRCEKNEAFLQALTQSQAVAGCKLTARILREFLNIGSGTIGMEGWLQKRSRYLKEWNRRYCAIVSGEFRWWSDDSTGTWSTAPNGARPLQSITVSKVSERGSSHMIILGPAHSSEVTQVAESENGEEEELWFQFEEEETANLWYTALIDAGAKEPPAENILLTPWRALASCPLGPAVLMFLLIAQNCMTASRHFLAYYRTSDLVSLYRAYSSTYFVLYLYLNHELFFLVSIGISTLWFENRFTEKYARILSQLKQHTPGVIKRFSGQICARLLPPVLVIVFDALLGAFLLPSLELFAEDLSSFMGTIALFFCYCIVVIDVEYLMQAREQQLELSRQDPNNSIGDIVKMLDGGEKILSWVDSSRFADAVDVFTGGVMKKIRTRFVGPKIKNVLSRILADSLVDPNIEKEIVVYCSRLMFNASLLAVFAIW